MHAANPEASCPHQSNSWELQPEQLLCHVFVAVAKGSCELIAWRAPLHPRTHGICEFPFAYDHVFQPEASQSDVYQAVAQPIVEGVIHGCWHLNPMSRPCLWELHGHPRQLRTLRLQWRNPGIWPDWQRQDTYHATRFILGQFQPAWPIGLKGKHCSKRHHEVWAFRRPGLRRHLCRSLRFPLNSRWWLATGGTQNVGLRHDQHLASIDTRKGDGCAEPWHRSARAAGSSD